MSWPPPKSERLPGFLYTREEIIAEMVRLMRSWPTPEIPSDEWDAAFDPAKLKKGKTP